jgi:hypothetical protein
MYVAARPSHQQMRICFVGDSFVVRVEQAISQRVLCLPSQASHQQADHRELDERFARLHLSLIVLAHRPVARQPAEGPFYDPSLLSNGESFRSRHMPDHFELPVAHSLAPLGQVFATIRAVRPDGLEAWNKVLQATKESSSTLRIMHVRRRDIVGKRDA